MPNLRFITARRSWFAGLALAGLLLTPAVAAAGKGRGEAKLARMCEQISCTEQQREDIARVLKQLRQDSKADRQAIRELRKRMADEWKAPEVDERELAKLGDEIAAHERNVADRRIEAMLELHAILTPEQREQVAEQLLAGRGRKSKSKSK